MGLVLPLGDRCHLSVYSPPQVPGLNIFRQTEIEQGPQSKAEDPASLKMLQTPRLRRHSGPLLG